MRTSTVLSLLVPAGLATATPVSSTAEGEGALTTTQLLDDAIATAVASADLATMATPPALLTIRVVNRHGSAITTSHAHEAGGPAAASGHVAPGTIKKGGTAAFAVPTGWAGNVAVNDAGSDITGDDSLVEASFKVPAGSDKAVADVDVSYVNGFTVPVTCSCAGHVVTGCNKNLWGLHECGKRNGEHACINPRRAKKGATSAAPFFAPCQGAAYTYVKDHKANSFGECQSGLITCCVGSDCPKNPQQP